jgi:ribosome-binding factor A
MKDYDRMLRVNELLKRELGILFEREICPQVPNLIVTITEVKTTPDLRQARVKFSLLGGDEFSRQEAVSLISRQRKHFQHLIAQHVAIKYTPVLRFVEDTTGVKADEVLTLLDELNLPED